MVGGLALAAIVAALLNTDSPSRANAVATNSTTEASLCSSSQLELSIRASGFAGHVAALRLSDTEPCDVGQLQVTATVVGRNGQPVPTTVAQPQQFTGLIHPGEELVASFDYRMRCRQKRPFSATVIAAGEVGSIRASAPVAFRRDPFTQHGC